MNNNNKYNEGTIGRSIQILVLIRLNVVMTASMQDNKFEYAR